MDDHKKSEPSSVAGGRDGVVAHRNHIRSLSATLQDYRIVQDSIDLAWLVILPAVRSPARVDKVQMVAGQIQATLQTLNRVYTRQAAA